MARGPIYITPEGHKKVREEVEWLWKTERPRVTHEVEVAAAHGDRSENAEYQYGKKRLGEIDRRLRFLSKRLEQMKVVPDELQRRNEGRVGFGAWVVVEDDEEGERACYRIVGPDEFDPDAGMISIASPMAKALAGKEVGDEVEVDRPRGTAYFTIVEIRYGDKPDPAKSA
jgi:transcription elongation factor GreB